VVEDLHQLEVHVVEQRQDTVAGAEPRVDAAVVELLTEQVRESRCGAGKSAGTGGEDEMVEAHG
jgi:hypothetical protein